MALVSGIFNILNEKIHELNLRRINKINLKVGDMVGVDDKTLKACFEVFAESTPAEDAELEIEHIPLRGKCGNCEMEFLLSNYRFQCPYCTESAIKIISGKGLYIESIEAE